MPRPRDDGAGGQIGESFHSKHAIKKCKDADTHLWKIRALSDRRMMLTWIAFVLGSVGLVLTAVAAEFCRYGYIPAEEEVLAGSIDPLSDPNLGCDGINANRLWYCQATISFSTLLLGITVTLRSRTALQEKDQQVLFLGKNTDPPDIEIISRRARFKRARDAKRALIIELITTVMLHPIPGFRGRVGVRALNRVSPYEFEAMVVIFMFGRLWHMWRLVTARLFELDFERSTYLLGNKLEVLDMMRHWDHLNNGLALKMLIKKHPVGMLANGSFWLIVMAGYCLRIAESPVNAFHADSFWNQLWLVVVTLTTTGYGDNVPATHFGRLICVCVMFLGTVLISLLTATTTKNLELNHHEAIICGHSDNTHRRHRVTVACCRYLQYIFRIARGSINEKWTLRSDLRRDFWKALNAYHYNLEEGNHGNPNSRLHFNNQDVGDADGRKTEGPDSGKGPPDWSTPTSPASQQTATQLQAIFSAMTTNAQETRTFREEVLVMQSAVVKMRLRSSALQAQVEQVVKDMGATFSRKEGMGAGGGGVFTGQGTSKSSNPPGASLTHSHTRREGRGGAQGGGRERPGSERKARRSSAKRSKSRDTRDLRVKEEMPPAGSSLMQTPCVFVYTPGRPPRERRSKSAERRRRHGSL
jgi:hypothetical protein